MWSASGSLCDSTRVLIIAVRAELARLTPTRMIMTLTSVHVLDTLPPLVFVDKYELANHHESYSFQFWGTSNLEYPVFEQNSRIPFFWLMSREALESA